LQRLTSEGLVRRRAVRSPSNPRQIIQARFLLFSKPLMAGLVVREGEMDGKRTTEALTVYKKPFFVNELLRIIQPGSITPEMFTEMVHESIAHEINTMLTAMTRQIDRSGLVPNFAGVYDDPQDVLEALMNLGHVQLLKVAGFDPEMQGEIFETLKGSQGMTLRALLVLDECQQEVIRQLVQVRQGSPLALALREANEEALKDLYKDPEKLYSPMFDEVVSLEDRCGMYTGKPHICYPKRVYQGRVVEVLQFFFMPKLGEIRLHAPFEMHTTGGILERITPKVFQRSCVDDSQYDPRTPSGFMGLLGKVGGALPRLIARQVKKNEQLREQVMREEELSTALYELFSR
jgi:hypothetical protein